MAVDLRSLKEYLPDYPQTPHMVSTHHVTADDIVLPAIPEDEGTTYVQEKVDGASMGIAVLPDGQLILRNRTHILNKAYPAKTTAKQQFVPAWTWAYEWKGFLESLNRRVGDTLGIYGEWLLVVHGVEYNHLPDKFIVYDMYSHNQGRWLDVETVWEYVNLLDMAYIHTERQQGIPDLETLLDMRGAKSNYGDEAREGIVIRWGNGQRCKLINRDYQQNSKFDNDRMIYQPSWTRKSK